MQAHGLKQLKKSELLSLTETEFLKRTHPYFHNIGLERAEYLLTNKPVGSWIIRPSNEPGKYVLTIKRASATEHSTSSSTAHSSGMGHYRLFDKKLEGLPKLVEAGFDIDIGGIARL